MEQNDSIKKLKTGTTTIGLVCSDGIILGADSRATSDSFIASTEAVKIIRINDGLGLTIAGGVGDNQYLGRLLKVHAELYKMNEGKDMTPTSAGSLLSMIQTENRMYPYYAVNMLGGMNGNVPELYIFAPDGSMIKESKFYSVGSGSPMAFGYLEDAYKQGISTQEGIKHVLKALKVAMKRDSASGDNLRIVTITKAGYKEYYGSEVEKLA